MFCQAKHQYLLIFYWKKMHLLKKSNYSAIMNIVYMILTTKNKQNTTIRQRIISTTILTMTMIINTKNTRIKNRNNHQQIITPSTNSIRLTTLKHPLSKPLRTITNNPLLLTQTKTIPNNKNQQQKINTPQLKKKHITTQQTTTLNR